MLKSYVSCYDFFSFFVITYRFYNILHNVKTHTQYSCDSQFSCKLYDLVVIFEQIWIKNTTMMLKNFCWTLLSMNHKGL
jgi:hypothetical protein